MKKILLFTSLSLLLTACSSDEVSKRVEQTTTSKVSQITQTTQKSNTTIEQTSTTVTVNGQTENNKENATKTVATEKTTTSKSNSVESSIEKLVSKIGQKYTIAGSEYQTMVVITLDAATEAYNTSLSANLSKEEVLAKIDEKVILEKVNSSFNEDDIRRVFAKDPDSVVIYFEEDGKLFLAIK